MITNKERIKDMLVEKVNLQLTEYINLLEKLYTVGEICEYDYDKLRNDAFEKSDNKKLKLKLVIGGYE